MKAKEILKKAEVTLTKERQKQYGDVTYNLALTSILWESYNEKHIDSIDVALMMALFKINRAKANKEHLDSYIDAISYLAAAAEIASENLSQ